MKVKLNWYSTPLWPGLHVTAVEYDGTCVARHQRNDGRGHQILNLEHYLDVLERKPGAMAGSAPLEQRMRQRYRLYYDIPEANPGQRRRVFRR